MVAVSSSTLYDILHVLIGSCQVGTAAVVVAAAAAAVDAGVVVTKTTATAAGVTDGDHSLPARLMHTLPLFCPVRGINY